MGRMNPTPDDMECVDIDAAYAARWLSRHRQHGSEPRHEKKFASIETAMLFDMELQRRLHPEARRFAVCLSSRLQKKLSLVEASEADIERWGIDAAATVPPGPGVYKQPWGVLTEQLKAVKVIEDLEKRPYAKRQLHLRLAPVFTNVRQASPLARPTEILKEKHIPTVAVPSSYFDGPVARSLSTDAFFVFMCLYALTDLAAFGGADPGHLQVRGGKFLVSRDLLGVLRLDPAELFDIVEDLERRGLVVLVPVRLREVWLPSSRTTYEWLADGADSEDETYVVRPTVVSGKATATSDKRQWQDNEFRRLPVEVTQQDGGATRIVVDEFVDVPQYMAGSNVVGDRLGASMKAQLRKAAKDLQLTDVDVRVDVWDTRPRALVHVYKLVADAVKHVVFGDDSNFVVRSIDIRRGLPDREMRPYIKVDVHQGHDDEASYSRKIYVRPTEWRPAAQRRTSPLSAWSTYSDYVSTLEATVQTMDMFALGVEELGSKAYELHVHIEAPASQRFDPDNVALFGCDLMTLWLQGRGECPAVDSLVERVLITHGEGEPSVALELRPM